MASQETQLEGMKIDKGNDPVGSIGLPRLSSFVIATTNANKLAEFKELLGSEDVIGVRLDNIRERQMEKEEIDQVRNGEYAGAAASIAKSKAIEAYNRFGEPVIIEDTWISFEGMEGRPGPLYSQVGTPQYNRDVCDIIHKLPLADGAKRSDKAVAIVTLARWNGEEGSEPEVWQGVLNGKVPVIPIGDNGFGFDTIFAPCKKSGEPVACETLPGGEKVGKNFAQMSPEEKDECSMRRMAVDEYRKSL